MTQVLTTGRVVLYRLSVDDAARIQQRRGYSGPNTGLGQVCAAIVVLPYPGNDRPVQVADLAVVVPGESALLPVSGRRLGDEPGEWHWPQREAASVVTSTPEGALRVEQPISTVRSPDYLVRVTHERSSDAILSWASATPPPLPLRAAQRVGHPHLYVELRGGSCVQWSRLAHAVRVGEPPAGPLAIAVLSVEGQGPEALVGYGVGEVTELSG